MNEGKMGKKMRASEWKNEFVMIKCQECGEEMKAATNLRKYCYDCREKRKIMLREESLKKKYSGNAKPKKVNKPMNLFKLV